MSKINPDLLVVLSSHVSELTSLEAIAGKYNLSFFNTLSPGIITSIDSEINVNPFIVSEAVSLLELAMQLNSFYSEDGSSFVELLVGNLIVSRISWEKSTSSTNTYDTLQPSLMGEYFVTSGNDLRNFLHTNPVYLGMYLYIYLKSVMLT